jgi:hypothetical protein
MFTLIKEFSQLALIPRLKECVEQKPRLAEFICVSEKPEVSNWQERWKEEGWSLAVCTGIAGSLEWRLPFREGLLDEDYTDAFLKALENPDRDFIVWMRYVLRNRVKMQTSAEARLFIWTFEDRAIVTSNPLKLLGDGSFFIFDPDSGLYRTDEAFTKELNEIASQYNFFILDPDDAFSADPSTVFISYPAAAFTDEEFIACLKIREMYKEKMRKVVTAFTGETEFKLSGTGLGAASLYEKRLFGRGPKKFTNEQWEEGLKRFKSKE